MPLKLQHYGTLQMCYYYYCYCYYLFWCIRNRCWWGWWTGVSRYSVSLTGTLFPMVEGDCFVSSQFFPCWCLVHFVLLSFALDTNLGVHSWNIFGELVAFLFTSFISPLHEVCTSRKFLWCFILCRNINMFVLVLASESLCCHQNTQIECFFHLFSLFV